MKSSKATMGKMLSDKIKRIVVLMMENRSFDHLLGFSDIVGLDKIPAGQMCPVHPNDPLSEKIEVNPNAFDECPDDPEHTFEGTRTQINNGRMDGFIQTQLDLNQSKLNAVSMFTPRTAPIINTLAAEYAVFDHWYASIPGPTDPNRAFAMGGTSMGTVTNFNGTMWPQESHINFLNVRNVTAGGYYQDDLWALGYYEDLHQSPNVERVKHLREFYRDLENDALPQYTWLQPRICVSGSYFDQRLPSWQHPDARVSLGEELIKDVYEALRGDDKWDETLFVITYDEHGGFYDHKVPPKTVAPDHNDWEGFKFDQLGLRVPTIAISPWIKKGTIYNEGRNEFDHTSLIKTVNEILLENAPPAPPMSERQEWANSFSGVIGDELRSDCPTKLPRIPALDTFDRAREVELQGQKPVNEHIEASLLFFCNRNYPDEFVENELCKAAEAAAGNQVQACSFMHQEQSKLFATTGRR
jgi:phospholipase C